MYLKLGFNKMKLKNHFRYFAWIYVIVVVAAGALLNISVTIAKNQSPPEKLLHSYICGDALSSTYFYLFLEQMEEAFPDMSVVSCENLSYNANGSMSAQFKQKFLTYISNGYGDVMILPYEDFADLASYGYFMPLQNDFAEYIDDLDPISLKTVTINVDDDGAQVLAIPLSHLEFFPKYYDTSDKVLVLMDYSKNKENAKELFRWYLNYMIETDWDDAE